MVFADVAMEKQNPFDLLGMSLTQANPRDALTADPTNAGNDPELDPDREPEPPTKALDKPVPRSGKRNAGGEAPAGRGGARGRGGTRGGAGDAVTGNEQGTSHNSVHAAPRPWATRTL